jgi:hypothetical protein
MTGHAVPYLSNPEGVFFRGVPGHDVAETSPHIGRALSYYREEVLALARDSSQLGDKSVHFIFSLRTRLDGLSQYHGGGQIV